MLMKAADILHRRCKGTPGIIRAYPNDPPALVALLRVLGGRLPGCYFSVPDPLPVRAILVPHRRLSLNERHMVCQRLAAIIRLYAARHLNRFTDSSDLVPISALRSCQADDIPDMIRHYRANSHIEGKLLIL